MSGKENEIVKANTRNADEVGLWSVAVVLAETTKHMTPSWDMQQAKVHTYPDVDAIVSGCQSA